MALHTQPLQPEYQHTEPLGGRVRYCPKRKRLRTLITLNSACTWAWGWSCAALEGFHVGLGKVDRPQFSFLQTVLGQTHPLNQSKRGPGWAPVLLVCRGGGCSGAILAGRSHQKQGQHGLSWKWCVSWYHSDRLAVYPAATQGET